MASGNDVTEDEASMCVHPAAIDTTRVRAPRAACLLGGAVLLLTLVAALAPSPATAFCFPQSVTPMVFTNYTPLGAGVMAQATINYRCVAQTSFADISISTPRTISSGTGTLTFEVYQDPGRAAVMPGAPALPLDLNGTSLTVWGFLPPQSSAPGTYTGTLTVTITSDGTTVRTKPLDVSTSGFVGSCTIQPATLLFGSYDPGAASPRDALATIAVACTAGTPYWVALDAGANPAGLTRQMASGLARLQYDLYSDAGRTTPWNTVTTVSGTAPTTDPIPLQVYGRIPAGQYVAAGSYTDTVQATINF